MFLYYVHPFHHSYGHQKKKSNKTTEAAFAHFIQDSERKKKTIKASPFFFSKFLIHPQTKLVFGFVWKLVGIFNENTKGFKILLND